MNGLGPLGERTWTEVAADPPVLLVPFGATEQHGPHLPLDTDTRIAVAVAERLAGHLGGVAVAPTIAIGASGEHAGFPGTLSIGRAVLEEVAVELTRSADAFRGVVWLNAHGGNIEPLRAARERLLGEGRDVLSLACWLPDGDPHAGVTETSLMLALAPESVRLDLAERGATDPWDELRERVVADGLQAVSPNGVLGDPTDASAAEGERLLDELVGRLGAELDARLRVWSNAGHD